MSKKINVLVVRPNEPPRVETHAETLETWQGLVGGLIQVIYPHDDDTCIILNDEGKIENLPMNRPLKDENGVPYDVMCGTFVIARAPEDSEDFESLTDEQVAKYTEMYREPISEVSEEFYEPLDDPMFEIIW